FFSSRRRHTRFSRDWSSDVCSSDLDLPTSIFFDTEKDFLKFLGKEKEVELFNENVEKIIDTFPELKDWIIKNPIKVIANQTDWRSEERRVGKESRARW